MICALRTQAREVLLKFNNNVQVSLFMGFSKIFNSNYFIGNLRSLSSIQT